MSLEKTSLQIIRDMNEGVMVLSGDGRINLVNKRALEILQKDEADLAGKKFAAVFFEDDRNDSFNQTVLDVVYDKEKVHQNVVPYFAGDMVRYIHMISSGLTMGGKTTDVILVLSDITELVEVREHLQMMEEIQKLNQQLQEKNAFIRKAFGRYLSDEIVEEVLDKPDGLSVGGKKENITVLMSDLRGFTALCEQLPPEQVMEMLNAYLERMGKIIREHKGIIIEYVGDGILSIFGVPREGRDHVRDALQAALQMQMAMDEVNDWNKERGYPMLRMGIGINNGYAIVGNMGSEAAMKYNVIGSTVNICGRIESYSTGGEILVPAYIVQQFGEELLTDRQIEIRPKGMKEPLRIYSVRGLKDGAVLKEAEETLIPLPESRRVDLQRMVGKKMSGVFETAEITHASPNRLVIRTDTQLEVYEDLALKGQGDLYGKVIRKEENRYLLAITGGDAKIL